MITIRKTTPADVPVIVAFIEKKATFDRSLGAFDGPLGTTPDRIARALFGTPVFAHALFALAGDSPVGFACFHFRFSTFQARPSLWLDDLFIDPEARRTGAGLALMSSLASEAALHDCTHIGWTASAKNPSGVPFYTKIGATLKSQQGSQLVYSITPETLATRVTQIRQTELPEGSVLTI